MDTNKIWDLYAIDLKKFILSKTKNITLTEDILQEVFIKIHTKKNTLKNQSNIKSWIFTIANNTMLDEFKKQSKVIAEESPEQHVLEKNEDFNHHKPEDCLLPLILRLPKKYRDVLFLSTIKNLKQLHISEELNISLPATKSRILRGRELLKHEYMDCCDYTLDENGHLKGENKNFDECKVCRPQPL
ncbi:hypothetical protein AXE80_01565 [Wenyingzhuangia fucanilytica]|uniref:RNA polymerase subunit sigma-70 n=1 Tax=Wenyingzhuangia fucanilytica TaxID=1790137 RepID=A0A1B1Y2R9_9FLAO|nr:sigma-70 family RNA polymerase sigma factor [Wenyingzhuangia fucanilytica]ANW95061.1 hypothetical protein AXE80_01565 [Wenyingzhuangia fucanilytica]